MKATRKRYGKRKRTVGTALTLGLAMLAGCKKDNDNRGRDDGNMNGPGGVGTLAVSATADLQGAFGLLVVENEKGAALNLMEQHNATADKLGLTSAPRFALPASSSDSLALHSGPVLPPIAIANGRSFGLAENAEQASPLQKIDSDGEIKAAITQDNRGTEQQNMGGPQRSLPDISTIAVSPTKEVYLHFRQPFIYRDAPMGEDPWDMAKGYQCQIFKVKGGTLDDLLVSTPDVNNLECIDNMHFINSWQTGRNTVFQFDAEGNVYYPGSLPNTSKTVVYKVSRDGSETSEVINANICVQDFLITERGGVFYTGQTCQANGGGGGGGGGGFFRYVSPGADGLVEIARDWWDFRFDTSVEDLASGGTADTAVFFGPNPTQSSTASWNSACLFKFDPTGASPNERISDVITCGSDIWSWMGLTRTVDVAEFGEGYWNYTGNDRTRTPSLAWKTEYARRCESKGQIFAGGGSQISAIKQDSEGQIYVIGNIRKKQEGALKCDVEVRGPHCVIEGNPTLQYNNNGTAVALNTQALCSFYQGTWFDKGQCSNGASTSDSCLAHGRTWSGSACSGPDNASSLSWREGCVPTWQTETVMYRNIEGDICTTAETGSRSTFYDWNSAANRFSASPVAGESAASALAAKFLVNNFSCTPVEESSSGGDQWTTELRALARVNKDTKSLTMLSTDKEQAIALWLVNDKPYYSSFDTSLGQYLLNGLVEEAVCVNDDYESESQCTSAGLAWSDRRCVNTAHTTRTSCEGANLEWLVAHPATIIDNFEAYNLAESETATGLYADGLDFSSNQYKFGTINLSTKAFSLKKGLTGTLKTIVILPKN